MPADTAGSISVPGSAAVEVPKGAEQASFVLRSFVIEGATAFSADELAPFYQDMLGKTITVADAFQAAANIELKYRNAGYVISRVVVPPQEVTDGVFKVRVIEGFISDIVVQEDVGPVSAAIKRLLSPLIGKTPVTVDEMERRLLLANDLAGMTVRATLKPSENATGGSEMLVEADRDAVSGTVSFDNRNSPYSGNAEGLGLVQFNSFGSHGDQLGIQTQLSSPIERSFSISANYQGMYSEDGLMLGLSSSYGRSRPGKELDALDVNSVVMAERAIATYPLIRSRLQNLRLSGEYEYRAIDTDVLDNPFNRDRIHIARAGISYDLTDSFQGITAVRATIHRGLGIFNATEKGDPLASRADASGSFTKGTIDLTRVQQVTQTVSLLATASGQYAVDPLLASEEMALGGANYGRGFDNNEFSGDDGWATSLEVRYSPDMPEVFPNGVQFYSFVDTGQVWNIDDNVSHERTSASSFGGGIRINILENLFASAEVAKGFRKPTSDSSTKPQAFFTLSAKF
ncbi:ShlB/FhaC/HecB family hemolysin secretion/activation protein [Thalassospira sp. TSL5-1]|uniref:ShlB/FhaC/HecB family hemolysin secretion/activation protein n=1 Tax=Thalassospira sp. TSL5-1 TaxID=1544451 RepID=UPI0009F96133|nr:ShlB/FhaC/HecB family hemolysin secretion/activation protein [Thalassospira sp. TSL5-1]